MADLAPEQRAEPKERVKGELKNEEEKVRPKRNLFDELMEGLDALAECRAGAGPYPAPDGGVCPPQQPTLALPKVCVRALCRMVAPTPDGVK
jgi:hypothetical protein